MTLQIGRVLFPDISNVQKEQLARKCSQFSDTSFRTREFSGIFGVVGKIDMSKPTVLENEE